MRILYVTPAFHHPSMRGPTRCYHFTRELSRRHAITLLSLTDQDVTAAARREMEGYSERIETVRTLALPPSRWGRALARLPGVGRRLARWLVLREAVGRMRRTFLQLVRDGSYDVVLFHGKSVAPLLEGWRALPVVVDFCDATSLRVRGQMRRAAWPKRALLLLRQLQVRRTERRLLRASPYQAFVSLRDRDAIVGPDRGEVVTIGVDHEFWRRAPGERRPTSIVFSGIMSYGPNEDAAWVLIERILPLVRQSIPDAQLTIVGRDPSARLQDRAARQPGVEVTGFVEDVRPHLARASIAAVPMRYGAGVQNKVLEAMSMELPVVATSLVAEGLRVADGPPPLVVADGDREFADRIVKLLGQEQERARLAAAGRRYVERHYDWRRSAARLERLCLRAVAAHRAAGASR